VRNSSGKPESYCLERWRCALNNAHGIVGISTTFIALGLFGCSNFNDDGEASISNVVPAESGIDYALQFDGINDYATTGTARFHMPVMPQTISLWVKIASTTSDQDWVTLRRDADSGDEFGLAAGGLPTVWRVYGPTTLVQSSTTLELNRWQFVAYVFDGTEHAIYVDGELVGKGTNSGNNRSPTMSWLGTFDGTQKLYEGWLDELRIWSVARAQAEIQNDMVSGGPKVDPNLVAYFDFNESGGQRAYDRSGNGNHASLGDGVPDCMPTRVLSDR
jgi:hypothetical protein